MNATKRKEWGVVDIYSKIKPGLGIKEEVFAAQVMSRSWPRLEWKGVY